MTDPVNVPVPRVVYTTAKRTAAALTTGLGVVTLFATQISDGLLSWGEAGTLIGAVATAVTTVIAVFRVPNDGVQ